MHRDDYDDYYLSQPIDDYDGQSKFERTSKYATVRQPRSENHSSPRHDFNDIHVLASQLHDKNYINSANHQPRSRAPISYNPQLYQDRSYVMPRYQPHLHYAKALTHLAMKERAKQSAQYLKESSV